MDTRRLLPRTTWISWGAAVSPAAVDLEYGRNLASVGRVGRGQESHGPEAPAWSPQTRGHLFSPP